MSAKGVSTKPASGFRDFVGREAARREHLIHQISKIYQSFGFEPIDSPALENLDVLFGSGGQENEKLIFKAIKRGEKLEEALQKSDYQNLCDLGLRFDLTVPLCRVFAAYRAELPTPWKVFHTGPVWRAERPQKGRYREFYQCDVDIVGSDSQLAELQVMEAVSEVFLHFGVKDLELHLNHRELLIGMAQKFGFSDHIEAFVILLDKADKIPLEKLEQEMEALLGAKLPAQLKDLLHGQLTLDDLRSDFLEPVETIEKLIQSYSLRFQNLPIRFVPSLARGMGYYTGAIFEFRLKAGGGSLGGGGRYDRLIGRFASQDTPAVGCSIGFERLLNYLEENQYFEKSSNVLFFPIFDKKFFEASQALASQIRQSGIRVDIYADESKIKNQFRYADSKNYRWVLIAGEDEWAKSVFKLKDMKEGHELEVTQAELFSKLQSLVLVDL